MKLASVCYSSLLGLLLTTPVATRGEAASCPGSTARVCPTPSDGSSPGNVNTRVFVWGQINIENLFVPFNSCVDVAPYVGLGSSSADSTGEPFYLQTPRVPGINCTYQAPPQNCTMCSGTINIPLFGNKGNIAGTVVQIPTPLAGPIRVDAKAINAPADIRTWTTTDASGNFDFTTGLGSPWAQNHWGLGIYVFGDGSGPGTQIYKVSVGSVAQSAAVFSSLTTPVNLVITDPVVEQPPRSCNAACCGNSNQNAPSPSTNSSQGPGTPSASEAPTSTGEPIDLLTGDMYLDQTDATIPGLGTGLVFTRSYNSLNLASGQYSVAFGQGWSHSYDQRVTFPETAVLALRKGNGVPVYYQDLDHDLVYYQSYPWSRESWITKSSSAPVTYTRSFRQGGFETYDSAGRFTSLTDRNGNTTTLGYETASPNRLLTINEPSGRTLTLAYAGSSLQPASLSGPDGLIASYTYVSGRLASVTYPDSAADADSNPDGGYAFGYEGSSRVDLQACKLEYSIVSPK